MMAFAANSVIARLALGIHGIDPGTFSLLRLTSGALALLLIVFFSATRARRKVEILGSWTSGTLLLVYAATFSYAYISLGAATGALVLFAVVQTVMLTVALRSGERPGIAGIVGLLLALTGLIILVGPGVSRPSPIGALLMSIAGVAWAGYTLRGRGTERPVLATAGNFLRSIPLALVPWLLHAMLNRNEVYVDLRGVGLALLSGVVMSGLGYAIWYTILPSLSRSQSGIIQMAPAPLATVGGLVLLGEPITARLAIASFLVLMGVLIGVLRPQPKKT
jgi:drug/metabolite transporter (DMT)-like permease